MYVHTYVCVYGFMVCMVLYVFICMHVSTLGTYLICCSCTVDNSGTKGDDDLLDDWLNDLNSAYPTKKVSAYNHEFYCVIITMHMYG